ncbi:MAG: protein phosphatase 2C domain-containing protein [Deltaproteobacteria bacterium]|jgi:protein phosphatase|nr:protein phosphatase 2C domain-containing protein [Deltaproteobacteria bacterium]MBW2533726.1 protein phosphatase 2C domain-containing protein [Deltaproteobacteria bacterium]
MAEGKPSAPLRVAAAGRTDVGRRRDHNEDNILLQRDLRLYVVADGMGGHNAGEVASALAAHSLENFFAASVSDGIPDAFGEGDGDLPLGAQRLRAAVRKANADVYEIASTKKQHSGMGSTVVAAHVAEDEGRMHICHVGDSRCYRIRDGEIEQLTRDHSLVNDALAMRPDLTEELLAELPANVITRAVGTQAKVEVDLRTEALEQDDLYLLCSDGLSGLVTAEQIADVCGLTQDLDEMCELLVVMANEAGGSDNISAIAIRVESADGQPPAAAQADEPSDDESFEGEADGDDLTDEEAAAIAAALQDEDSVEISVDEGDAAADDVSVDQNVVVDIADDEAVEDDRSVVHLVVPAGSDDDDVDQQRDEAPLVLPVQAIGEAEPASDEALVALEEATADGDAGDGFAASVSLCAQCGNELVAGMTFCVECGALVEEGSAKVVPLSDLQTEAEAELEVVDDEPPAPEEVEEAAVEEEEAAAAPESVRVESRDEAVLDEMLDDVCPDCGAELMPENLFCVECGAKVG